MSRRDLWTADELRAFLAASADTRLEAAWHLLAIGGLRVGELLALRWTDVDTHAGRIKVRNAVVGAPYSDLAEPHATTRARAIDVLPVLDVLDRHYLRQAAARSEWGAGYHDEDLVVCRENGCPQHPRDLHRVFRQVATDAVQPPIGLADLRRSGLRANRSAGVRS